MSTKQISLRLDSELVSRVDEESGGVGRSRNEWIAGVLSAAVGRCPACGRGGGGVLVSGVGSEPDAVLVSPEATDVADVEPDPERLERARAAMGRAGQKERPLCGDPGCKMKIPHGAH